VARDEMLRTFNCGVGMVVVVDAGGAGDVRAVLEREGETVIQIGRLVPRDGAAVTYAGTLAL
jgi:phosphoribosylaminoimidazole (AIR) synthetase